MVRTGLSEIGGIADGKECSSDITAARQQTLDPNRIVRIAMHSRSRNNPEEVVEIIKSAFKLCAAVRSRMVCNVPCARSQMVTLPNVILRKKRFTTALIVWDGVNCQWQVWYISQRWNVLIPEGRETTSEGIRFDNWNAILNSKAKRLASLLWLCPTGSKLQRVFELMGNLNLTGTRPNVEKVGERERVNIYRHT